MVNTTVEYEEPNWNSSAAWKLPGWAEPVVRIAIHGWYKKILIS